MTHLLLSHGALVHSPVKTADYGFPDFIKVVNTFGHIHENVGSCSLRTEGPNLPCFSHVPVVRVGQIAGTGLTVSEDILKLKTFIPALALCDSNKRWGELF